MNDLIVYISTFLWGIICGCRMPCVGVVFALSFQQMGKEIFTSYMYGFMLGEIIKNLDLHKKVKNK